MNIKKRLKNQEKEMCKILFFYEAVIQAKTRFTPLKTKSIYCLILIIKSFLHYSLKLAKCRFPLLFFCYIVSSGNGIKSSTSSLCSPMIFSIQTISYQVSNFLPHFLKHPTVL